MLFGHRTITSKSSLYGGCRITTHFIEGKCSQFSGPSSLLPHLAMLCHHDGEYVLRLLGASGSLQLGWATIAGGRTDFSIQFYNTIFNYLSMYLFCEGWEVKEDLPP